MREPHKQHRQLRRALLLTVALALPIGALGAGAMANVPPPAAGWSIIWSDDFNGAANTRVDTAKWLYTTGTSYPGGPANFGTGEVETMTNSTANVYQDGVGNLHIKPIRDGNGNWTSGRIETVRSDFKPPAGGKLAIESRIQMPNVTGDAALGYWPAFWALGSPYRGNWWNWPAIGEFDIMENVNGMNAVWGVLHCGSAPGGPCNENTGIAASRPCPGQACQAAFHTYRFEWDTSVSPNQLRWYVDGQQFHSISQAQLPAEAWAAMTSHAGYFIILNVAIGGAFPDALAGSTPAAATVSGVPMKVDYVAVSTAGGVTPSPSPTTTGPTPSPTPSQPAGSAYTTREAERYSAQSGVAVASVAGASGGSAVTQVSNGKWVAYNGVDFGSGAGATQFIAGYSSGAEAGRSGLLEVRLDSPTAPVIGSVAVGNTGGWTSWRSVPGSIQRTTGVHTVYITFTSGQPAEYAYLDWIRFGA